MGLFKEKGGESIVVACAMKDEATVEKDLKKGYSVRQDSQPDNLKVTKGAAVFAAARKLFEAVKSQPYNLASNNCQVHTCLIELFKSVHPVRICSRNGPLCADLQHESRQGAAQPRGGQGAGLQTGTARAVRAQLDAGVNAAAATGRTELGGAGRRVGGVRFQLQVVLHQEDRPHPQRGGGPGGERPAAPHERTDDRVMEST